MTPKEAITNLMESGVSQPAIVALLNQDGVKTTQETVSRISTGAIKNPSFRLGSALVALAESYEKQPAA